MALAGLQFIDRAEAVHLIGPPGTRQDPLPAWRSACAVKAGRSVYFSSLADIVASLARAEREGALRERISDTSAASPCSLSTKSATSRSSLAAAICSFQLVNARYAAMGP